jgi:hypothetical protein
MGQTSRREASGSELGGRRSRPRFGRCSCCWTGFPGTRAQVRNGAWVKPRRSLPSGEVRALVPTCRPRVAPGGGRLSVPCRLRPLPFRAAPEPLRGAPRRAPRAPRRRVRPACGGLALGLRLTVTLFPFQEKPDRFPGDAGTGAPTLASVENEIGGPRLWCPRGLRVCRWECDPIGPAWFSWVAPSAPGPRHLAVCSQVSLSGCGLASVRTRLHVCPGCGGVLHS